MIVTTCDITDKKYEVLEIVFGYGSSGGLFKSANPMEAYPKVRDQLKVSAEKLKADALIGVNFDYRVAVNTGCGSSSQVFEVFAYATAVKFIWLMHF